MTAGRISAWSIVLALLLATPAFAAEAPDVPVTPIQNGHDVYQRFHDGLADPVCEKESSSPRWRRHFANAPRRLVARDDNALALFGYVVDALRAASLPTEYALIPFVESGYKPGAQSPLGPAGMWQMIKVTARNHHVAIRGGYDGRLSPVDSTRAAVRYLKTLHGMFAGDWRLSVMAYNAGEYRVFGALKHSGQVARSAEPEKLTSLSGVTRAYVRKLHALSCLLDRADDDPQWLRAMDRPVPVFEAVVLPPHVTSLKAWADMEGRDPTVVRSLNPAFIGGRVARAGHAQRVLVPMPVAMGAEDAGIDSAHAKGSIAAVPEGSSSDDSPTALPATHTVAKGESSWTIAHEYGLSTRQLLSLNSLTTRSVLQPGRVLRLREQDSSPTGE